MQSETLEFIYSMDGILAVEAWNMMWRVLEHELREDGTTVMYYDKKIKLDNVASHIAQTKEDFFGVRTKRWTLHLSTVGSANHCLVTLESSARSFDEWRKLAKPFLTSTLISGRIHDDEYERWENAEDPIIYTAFGRSYAHLPMVSNGLPDPLEQMVVDISRNPGRRTINRTGYVAALGSLMWLGPLFSERTGCEISALKKLDWCRLERLPSGVWELQAWPECFRTAEGEEGRRQDELRAKLFPKQE
jgi:hypothetical protein